MFTVGPFEYNADDQWECNNLPERSTTYIYGSHSRTGAMCAGGLEDALGEELDKDRVYEFRLYKKKPRTEVVKLTFNDYDQVVDENGDDYELSTEISRVLRENFKANIGDITRCDEVSFYVRAVDKGPRERVIEDVSVEDGELILISEDGAEARFEIDLNELEWVYE